MTCDHKWKIFKKFKKEGKNLMGIKYFDTVYHLQCEKCGEMKSQIAQGYDEADDQNN